MLATNETSLILHPLVHTHFQWPMRNQHKVFLLLLCCHEALGCVFRMLHRLRVIKERSKETSLPIVRQIQSSRFLVTRKVI